ncbi:MAG: outer-membrane lipoprotein carrier protein LolA [Bacteroidota bacterium]|jgi:outer membrane lipoprotein-sorting protein
MNKITLSIIAFLLFFNVSQTRIFAQNEISHTECFNSIKEKYNKINAISFKFTSADNPDFRGTLSAESSNKYRLDLKNRTIVSNGKTLWNFDKTTNKVVITSIDESDAGSGHIQTFFFGFISQFQSTELKTEISAKGGTRSYTLYLDAKNPQKSDIKKAILSLNPKTLGINAVQVLSDGKWQKWEIRDIKLNKVVGAKYEFTPPEDAQIIDMR